MDFISSSKNVGSSAFGSSGNASSGTSSEGMFSNFFNLSIQKMVLLLAVIAFVISIGTVAVLLMKSKSAQKWPPEISKCPDRMELQTDGNCKDNYNLVGSTVIQKSNDDNCTNFNNVNGKKYGGEGLNGVDEGYIPWEGIVDGQGSRASSLKCLT
jgi:hypothetical protein